MTLPFVKMHGLGNDFVVVDCRDREWGDWQVLSRRLADRHFGVGCDQVLLLRGSRTADVRMDIYNPDGSRVEMCGNGIRCLARYLGERGELRGDRLRVETLAGLVEPRLCGELVEVDMGAPEFEGRRIPVDADGPVLDHPLRVGGAPLSVTCVSMGNPHAVVFVDDATACPVAELGPKLETHPFFPNRVNVEFVQVLSADAIRMRVWERGAGLTLACGSGACAAVAAGQRSGRTARAVRVHLDGGELAIRWDAASGHLFMTGPAVTVFEGQFRL